MPLIPRPLVRHPKCPGAYHAAVRPASAPSARPSPMGSPLPVNTLPLILEQPCTAGFGSPCPIMVGQASASGSPLGRASAPPDGNRIMPGVVSGRRVTLEADPIVTATEFSGARTGTFPDQSSEAFALLDAPAASGVPEPATWLLSLSCFLPLAVRQVRRSRRNCKRAGKSYGASARPRSV